MQGSPNIEQVPSKTATQPYFNRRSEHLVFNKPYAGCVNDIKRSKNAGPKLDPLPANASATLPVDGAQHGSAFPGPDRTVGADDTVKLVAQPA